MTFFKKKIQVTRVELPAIPQVLRLGLSSAKVPKKNCFPKNDGVFQVRLVSPLNKPGAQALVNQSMYFLYEDGDFFQPTSWRVFQLKESWCFTRKKILQCILDQIQRLIAAVGRHRVTQHVLGWLGRSWWKTFFNILS